MSPPQGDLALLNDPVAQELWFHWTGQELVLGTPPTAPKVQALQQNPEVAVTIDSTTWPYHVLLIRGTAQLDTVEGVAPEYAAAAERYFDPEQGRAWVEGVRQMTPRMTRVVIRPEWVGILDFETRFPSAIAAAMGAG